MKRWLLLLLLPLLSQPLSAQIGFSLGYAQLLHRDWDQFITDSDYRPESGRLLQNAPRIGIDFRHRLKNKRIEFLPELSLSFTDSRLLSDLSTTDPLELQLKLYSFQYHAQVYPLDLDGDCNCPTFSKGGPTLEKGFYVQFAPGLNLFQKTINGSDIQSDENDLYFSLGAGLGFDLGLSERITLSPFAKASWYLHPSWENLNQLGIVGTDEQNQTSFYQWVIGLHLGLNLSRN